MYYTIYKITNITNDKYYIGSHKTENLEDNYMGSGKLIKEAINKYGIDSFNKEYLCFAFTEQDMDLIERELVVPHFLDSNSYNIEFGGNRPPNHKGRTRSIEVRKKIGESQLGVKNHRYGKVAWNIGKLWDSIVVEKLRPTMFKVGVINGPKAGDPRMLRGENHPMKNEENRKKVSEARKGKKWFHNPNTKQIICIYPNNIPFGFKPGKKVV